MTAFQKIVKYVAFAFAIFLTLSILGGILGAIGLFGNLFIGDAETEEIKTYSVSSEIQILEIKINAADFRIARGDVFSVESNLKHLSVEDKNGVLSIKETKTFAHSYTGAVLNLYVPKDTVFEKINITTGAGRLTVDRLSASKINFEFGAGEATLDTLVATSEIDIEGGAGKITISGGALHNLDLDMGVGQLNLTSALTGECDFDLGVGESNLTFLGDKDDYTLDIEKGIGNITLDGKSISNLKEKGGKDRIEISGGIGSIHINFQDGEDA